MILLKEYLSKHIPKYNHSIFAVNSHISKQERIILFIIFALFTAAFCYFQIAIAWQHNLDSSFLMENLTSIKNTGIPTTYLGQTIYDVFNPNILVLNAEALCKSELMPSDLGAANILDTHAYFILYPLAILTWLFPPHIILAVANGLSFVSVIYILYWVFRKQGTPIVAAASFCLLTMAHPAWTFSAIGDFYADRFFMPLGLLYASLLHEATMHRNGITRSNFLVIFFIGLLASITTERGAIMIAFFTLSFIFLYRKKITERTAIIWLSVFSFSLLIYVLLYLQFLYVQHPGTGNLYAILQGIPDFMNQINDPAYFAKTQEFIIINIFIFGIFAVFDWRLALIAFFALLPNLLTSIGGAEKSGWATHYHSMYFPFLVFASAIGFSKLWTYLRLTKFRLLLIALVLSLIPTFNHFYSPGYTDQRGILARLYNFYSNELQSSEMQNYNKLHLLAAAVPEGAKVTALEGYVSALYLNRTIYYYPIGIDTADYAVLNRVNKTDGTFYYAGAVSYLVGEAPKADICLNERLIKAGYNLKQPRLLVGSMAVLERIK